MAQLGYLLKPSSAIYIFALSYVWMAHLVFRKGGIVWSTRAYNHVLPRCNKLMFVTDNSN